jgi:hypothetical protein
VPTYSFDEANIEAIELQLEKLLGGGLDPMPRRPPVLWGVATIKDGHAIYLDPDRPEHGAVYERRATAPEGRRHNGNRSEMLAGQDIPQLVRGMESVWFDVMHRDDLGILDPRQAAQEFSDSAGNGVRPLGALLSGVGRDEDSGREARTLQGRGALEEEIAGIEVLNLRLSNPHWPVA